MKTHDLKSIVIWNEQFQYFYTRERNDRNGHPRYRVYIIDPDAPAVHETIFKCYESQIPEYVDNYIACYIGVTVPF